MKDLSDITVCIVDYGKFILLSKAFVPFAKQTLYHSPMEKEFRDVRDCVRGDGLDGVIRVDDFFEPKVFDEIDLFVFPDIGFSGLQKYLRSIGKSVWGAMGASDLELLRTRFIKFLEDVGLEHVPTEKVNGISALSERLKSVDHKWVKINEYRAQTETRYHVDFDHSSRWLDSMAVKFGGLKELPVFIIQDEIVDNGEGNVIEIGYDGWTVDGQYPIRSFQGYEAKNEAYLGSLREYTELPIQILAVNEAISPALKEYGYRNFMATEIRVVGDKFYFIDPTFRTAGLTQDQLPYTCDNLAEVIWRGANGELIEPKFNAEFVAVSTLHYKTHVEGEWFTLNIPDEASEHSCFYHYCRDGSLHHFIPSVPYECDEAGVVMGKGTTVEDAIENLKSNFKLLEQLPLTIDLSEFAPLLEEIKEAESADIEFSDSELPKPEIALK